MKKLIQQYGRREANAILRLVAETRFSLSQTDLLLGRMDALPEVQKREWEEILRRLHEGEPVQYVLEEAWFLSRPFRVTPDVLIPRPETEEMVRLILDHRFSSQNPSGLDLCTGSGCIAVSLALGGFAMMATDVSDAALVVAEENAKRLKADVRFVQEDLLAADVSAHGVSSWDLIVSNPPYVLEKERAEMEHHVLDYEPSHAFFVPDDSPLLFYEAIAKTAKTALRPQGLLAVEANRAFTKDVAALFRESGFCDIKVYEDQYNNPRFVFATAPGSLC